jgi:hypothetical protein
MKVRVILGFVAIILSRDAPAQDLRTELQQKSVASGLALGYIGGSAMEIFPTAGGPLTNELLENYSGPCRICPGWFSSDGNLVIWLNQPFNERSRQPLIIRTIKGNTVRAWSGEIFAEIRALALSPDRSRVAVEQRIDSRSSLRGGLQYFALSTPNRVVIEPQPSREEASGSESVGWSPDSRSIVFSRHGKVIILNIEIGNRREIASGTNPSWSPDGQWISFTAPEGVPMLVAPSGHAPVILWKGRRISGPMAWSPDSAYLSFSASEKDVTRMIVYRVRDGEWLPLAQFGSEGGYSNGFGWLYNYKDFLAYNESKKPRE